MYWFWCWYVDVRLGAAAVVVLVVVFVEMLMMMVIIMVVMIIMMMVVMFMITSGMACHKYSSVWNEATHWISAYRTSGKVPYIF